MRGERCTIRVTVNGRRYERAVEQRLLLSDFLRQELRLTGTHLGCGHGVCGACTIFFEGAAARSCILLAVQADGKEITTVEGLETEGRLNPVQQAFHEEHALQCGYCTPGFLITVTEFLARNPEPSDDEIRHALAGNICRCTGYVNIIRAVRNAARKLQAIAESALPPLGDRHGR